MTTGTPAPTPAPAPAAAADLAPFVVEIKQKDGTKVQRLVNAKRREHARDHLFADGTLVIRKATAREAMELAVSGVRPETAANEPTELSS